MTGRFLIRIFPWIFSVIIIVVVYFLLQNKMEEELHEAKLSMQQVYVEEEILSLGKIELMHYKFKDVLFFQSLKPYLEKTYKIPDTEPIVIINGVAAAGIDFSTIGPENFEFKNDSALVLRIPKPKQFSFTVSDELQLITSYKISEEEVRSAIKKMMASDSSQVIKPLELEIKNEHLLSVLSPVLETITNEKITIRFSDE